MVISNTTFMMPCQKEVEFIEWIRSQLADVPAPGLRISAMREAGGIDYTRAEAQSVAVQCEFPTIEEARKWASTEMAQIAARFEEKYAPHGLVFNSIFEIV